MTTEGFTTTATDFERQWNLPNCVGAIDGKHIRIVKPAASSSLFYNYKGYFSIILMAACDSNAMFTMVDVGAYGSQSDGGVLRNSHFGRRLLEGRLPIPGPRSLPNTDTSLPHFFVGDAAFPLHQNIMRPYPGMDLTAVQKYANYRLSRARISIERAFGIMSARWRILLGCLEFAPKRCENVVLACVVLHNFMMGRHGGVLDDAPDGGQLDGVVEEEENENATVIASSDMRDTLANYLDVNRIRSRD